MEVVGVDAVERRERPSEHVIQAAKLAGALDRHDVGRLFDDADDGLVAPGVGVVKYCVWLSATNVVAVSCGSPLNSMDFSRGRSSAKKLPISMRARAAPMQKCTP